MNSEKSETNEKIPFVAYEAAMARLERSAKRLWITLFFALASLFASNALWLWAWMQYDYESYELIAEGDSNANYIGERGNIYNGSDSEGPEAQKEGAVARNEDEAETINGHQS